MNPSELKVLMISSDRNILTEGSAVRERMKEYAQAVAELHIVLLSDTSHGLKNAQIGTNIWVYPTNSLSKYLRSSDAARRGKKIIFDRKFVRGKSVITTQDPFECGLAGLKVKNKWRIPLEVQLHTDPSSPYFTGFQNNIRKSFARRVLKNADSVRVVSEYLKTRIIPYTKAPISVLPIYIDKERIEEGHITFDLHARFGWHFILLTVARLTTEKNLGLAIDVLKGVVEKFPSTGLVIVGSGSEEESLKSKVNKLGLSDKVAFDGWQENLASYYRTANLYLQTSTFEGYGMSLVEAGLSGLPVATTPVGIAQDLVHGKDAYIYPVGEIELFTNGVIDLIENNFKRENLKMNLKQTLETKLLSKDEYLNAIKTLWVQCAVDNLDY